MSTLQYDLMEGAVGVPIRIPLFDHNNAPLTLNSGTDSVSFRWWFQGDEAAARVAAATIEQENPAIALYVTTPGDLDQDGILWGQGIINAPSLGLTSAPTVPQAYEVGPLVGP